MYLLFQISVVISRIKAWEYATGIFVSSLVVADLLRGLTVMPFILLHSLFWRQWDLSGPFCNLSGFTNTLLLNASVLTLAAVAIDRWVQTKDTAGIIILIFGAFSAIQRLSRTFGILFFITFSALLRPSRD